MNVLRIVRAVLVVCFGLVGCRVCKWKVMPVSPSELDLSRERQARADGRGPLQ